MGLPGYITSILVTLFSGITASVSVVSLAFLFIAFFYGTALWKFFEKTLLAGRALGYKKEQIWLKILIPRLYPHLRLSIFAIIAYSLSVVDMAIILGPSSPPPLAVLILKWFNDPDMSFKLIAAAGSLFLFFIVLLSILSVYLIERSVGGFSRRWILNGSRHSLLDPWAIKLVAAPLDACAQYLKKKNIKPDQVTMAGSWISVWILFFILQWWQDLRFPTLKTMPFPQSFCCLVLWEQGPVFLLFPSWLRNRG